MRVPMPWSPVEVRKSIEADRDDVFNVLADPRTYPEWLVGAQRIRAVDPAFPNPGTEFHHSVGPTDELTVDDKTKAIEKQGHRRLVLEVHVGPARGEVEFTLQRRSSHTDVVLRERPIGAALLLTPLVRPLLALRNRKSLDQLARYVEALQGASAAK